MSENRNLRSEFKDLEKNGEKILYSDNMIVCFACGEEIDKNIEICPYCKTNLE
ncbi:MAG: hypothetical protein JSV62_07240 [Promethearchaeota archaeon]|nr:MAG: hypothetical protein JSV62_07240 [Candidatus Lokiarchaeota archaeon]